tara:strand:+ start:289 stop:2340 length:2052 start_codon:yes stop_codon:yes gene_type:complete
MTAIAKASFVSGMDNSYGNKIQTENGAIQLSSSGETLVDLFFNSVRSTPKERLHELMEKVIDAMKSSEKDQATRIAHDLVVAMFHCRATRGMGKGERKLFVWMLVKLNAYWPKTINALISEIPFYGCWKDLLEIVAELDANENESEKVLRKSCLSLFAMQINKDLKKLEEYESMKKQEEENKVSAPHLSFAAKWAPRERKTYDKKYKVVDEIASYMFPSKSVVGGGETKYKRRKLYRNVLTRLCKSLSIPEIYMSSKKWGEINFKNVPSVCMNKLSKAFLNESIKEINMDLEKGNRHPDDADRILCRKHMIDNLAKGQINSKQLFPHEVVRKCMHGKASTSTDRLLCNVQWKGIRESVIKSLEEAKEGLKSGDGMDIDVIQANGEVVKEKVDLGKIVPLVDVSGSMSGEPMEVAIALGILISEVAQPSFRDRVITFESNPRWHKLNPAHDISQKVTSLQAAPWGGSTSIEKALELIYQVVKSNKLAMDEVPDMIVFSDMQFDQANGDCGGYGYGRNNNVSNWETTHQMIEKAFNKLGMEICGKPYDPPRIIYWNIRGNSSSGIHAPVESDKENVQMLSGYSPALMKLVLAGELEEELVEEETVDENGAVIIKKVKKKITPYDTFRKAVDDECFDRVRVILDESTEGIFATYAWENEVDDVVLVQTDSSVVEEKIEDEDDLVLV